MRNGAVLAEIGHVEWPSPEFMVDAIWKVLPRGIRVLDVEVAENFEILSQGNGDPIETQCGGGVVCNEITLAVACL